jgi:hypothetical protein
MPSKEKDDKQHSRPEDAPADAQGEVERDGVIIHGDDPPPGDEQGDEEKGDE